MDSPKHIKFIKLPDFETIKCLHDYKKLLLSLLIKNIVSHTIGGYTNYLSHCLLEEIEIKNEICTIINSTVIKLPSFNIYAGVIISSFLAKLWSDPSYQTTKMIEKLIEFKTILDEALNYLKYQGNWDVKSLQYNVEKILLQEPSVYFSNESLNAISFQIVKAVLAEVNIDNNELKVGRVHIHVEHGSDNFLMVSGVICKVDDEIINLIGRLKSKSTECNKVLLFTDDICDFDMFMSIIEVLLENDIRLVVCQKKISNALKLVFRRNSVIVIERVGLETAKSIEQVTECVPIKSMNKLTSKISSYVGHYSTLGIKKLNDSVYIVLETYDKNISTLYVSCRSFSDVSYTKKVCSQSIRFIHSALSNSYFLPGPISFENKLCFYLKNMNTNCHVTTHIITLFCDVLNEILINYKIGEHEFDSSQNSFHASRDSYPLKRNAFMVCIDGLINFLSISTVIRKWSK